LKFKILRTSSISSRQKNVKAKTGNLNTLKKRPNFGKRPNNKEELKNARNGQNDI
jgi:hypothetical protein